MRKELPLNGTWRFIEIESGEIEAQEPCLPAKAEYFEGHFPGSIQGALIDCGKMGSPFFGHGHEDFRWIEDADWYMVKEFKHSREKGKRYVLRFEGIDGVGRIYLNGSALGFVQNMFTPYEFDVTELLKEDNRIGIRFYGYVKVARSRDRRGLMAQDFKEEWPPDPDWFCASYIRKGNFACGDDMSQRLMTVGLWKPVKLVAYDHARILDNQIITRLEGNMAMLTISTEVESLLAASAPLQLTFRVSEEATGKCIGEKTLDIAPETGVNAMPCTMSVSHTFQVENPRLWWPNAIGEETSLYVLQADLLVGGSVIDSKTEVFGIREIRLVQEPDTAEGGRTFTIEVNGRKVFCKGSNWVPADTLIYPVDDQRYEDLIASARDANFTMFRINGFGVYESDKFYELCNRYGIMIWQDFMFSDCVYDDGNPDFMAEARRECEAVVKMLRNHPCLVLWCGNNEVQWMKWGSGKESRLFEVWGEKIFHELMPEIVGRLDPTRPYWPGSPWNEDKDVPNSLTQGCCHLYPWAGLSPVEHTEEGASVPDKWSWENVSWHAYLRNNAKFFCEYGLRAFPDVSTMRSIMPEDRLWPMDRDEYQYHCTWDVPEPHLIDRMKLIIGKEFQDPAGIDSLEEFTWYTQLVQGKTLQIAAEHHRSRMYSCSGSLFWQYNDCWPCSTFSIVDHYLRKKAGYYFVKRAFAPVILTFRDRAEEQSVQVWAVNDLGRDVKGEYTLSIKSFEGQVFWQSERELTIPANSAIKCGEVGETVTGNHDRGTIFLHAEFAVPGKERIESFHLFEFDREISYPKCNMKVTLDRISSREYMVALETDNYARVVSVDAEGELDDNFFDMAPRSMRTVRVRLRSDCCEDPSVSIKTLNT